MNTTIQYKLGVNNWPEAWVAESAGDGRRQGYTLHVRKSAVPCNSGKCR